MLMHVSEVTAFLVMLRYRQRRIYLVSEVSTNLLGSVRDKHCSFMSKIHSHT